MSAQPQPAASPVVHGIDTTAQTQCAHWHSPRDVIAIRHRCCGEYYACISCHEALATHAPEVWPKSEWHTAKAVLCGKCRTELTIAQYLACESTCPHCRAAFNPGCARHYDLYFEKQTDSDNTVTDGNKA
ncbi:zinc finger CHY domain-containing protein [Microdochium trichocladiopsis]|uniref:Zinc finger CHY domain-containing protein n=1 Tax=Microdochium trichocladiopsis TaxID=1682393 RepID=A0A9P9BJ71_9PEZI|nr:zinc finger CHY domain-containing protein [Microdochium trichocladiopsis]KAH7014341.1 zinc finger CHY domain-containing protein [Microdochium trichocladiopsis]